MLLGKIRSIAAEIYSILGTGHNESIYHKAMELELRNLQIPHVSKPPISIYYKNQIIGYHEPDIIIYNETTTPEIVIELKASANKIRATERAQLLSYMRTLKCERGILINFPQPSNKSPDLNENISNNIDCFHVGFYLLDSLPQNTKQIPCVDLNDHI